MDRHHARAGAGRLAADAVAVVSRLGDVIVYDGASGTRTFVTRTTGAESSARSTRNDTHVTYVRDGNLICHGMVDAEPRLPSLESRRYTDPPMPLDSDAVLDLFRRSGALLEGHFKLTSGLHSERYLQSALVLQYPDLAEALGRELGARTAHMQPTAVLSPALGGIVIGQEVARALGVRALFVERQEGALTLRRGFTLSDADRVLVVEDVLTTGGSTRETAAVAQAHGAQVIGAAVIVDRGADPARLNLPLQALVKLEVPTYAPDVCPLCAKNVPVVKPGSRV